MPRQDYNGFLELVCHPALVVSGGRVVSANARLAGLTGHAGSELVGVRVRELVDSNERPQGSRRQPGQGLAPGFHAGGLFRKDGGRVAARFVTRFLDHGSRPRDMLVVLDETAARPSGGVGAPGAERLLEECLRAAEAGVVVIAANGLVALANRRCCELLGYQDLEIIGRPWAGIFVKRGDRSRASENFEKLVSGEMPPRD